MYPCLAAHLDTVYPLPPVEIVERDGVLIDLDSHGCRAGMGGDDKAGVFICLELLERFENMVVAFFASEETGCVGAYRAEPEFFRNVGCVIEFDSPGGGIVSHSAGGEQLFANDGQFISLHWRGAA